jgi:hypothetical protein
MNGNNMRQTTSQALQQGQRNNITPRIKKQKRMNNLNKRKKCGPNNGIEFFYPSQIS